MKLGKQLAGYCQLCGERITKPLKPLRHPQWPAGLSMLVCENCQAVRPRCRNCGMPLAEPVASPLISSPVAQACGQDLCPTCCQMLRFCLACGVAVGEANSGGRYYEFDGVGPYCETCLQQRPPCDVCGAPLSNQQWQLSDGRRICASCYSTAIYAPTAATALYEEVQNLVDQMLGLRLNIPTGLALVDRNQLAEIIRRQEAASSRTLPGASQSPRTPLDPLQTLGIYARRGLRRGIYLQTGLPRLLFLQVTAHELAHAWQGENCPLLEDPVRHEGQAEWVAYRVLGHYGYLRSQERMRARQDIYGQGLRWALKLEAEQGASAVLRFCQEVPQEVA